MTKYSVEVKQLGSDQFSHVIAVEADDDIKAGIRAIEKTRKAFPDLQFLTARNIQRVQEKSLREQMNPTDAERALNIAKLTDDKLKVVEARLSGINKDFREITQNAVDRVKPALETISADVKALREYTQKLQDRQDVLINRISRSFILRWLFQYTKWFDVTGELQSDKREL